MEEYITKLKAISCIMRIRILRILQRVEGGLCVCEIMDSLDENQYNISRHLKILKNAGFVHDEKKGRWIAYTLTEPNSSFEKKLYDTVASIPEEEFKKDFSRLQKRLSLRKDGECIIGITGRVDQV